MARPLPEEPPTGPVTNEGVLSAGPNGQVVLVGTDVTNTGTIDAPSGQVILAAGSTVTVSETPSSSLSVAATGGGTVLDSGVIKAENLDGTPGTVTVKAGMTTGGVDIAPTAVIDASAPVSGNGGTVTIDASEVVLDNATPFNVTASRGTPGTVAIDPNLILSGTTIDVCNATGLETIDQGTSGNQASLAIAGTTTDPLSDTIVLESNMNLATGSTNYAWTPLGNATTNFTGTFNGQGHTVSGYTITANGLEAGFIGYLGSGGIVENLGVAGTVSGNTDVGGVVGFNCGTVKTSYNTGSVSGNTSVGGVVGDNHGTVETSYNTGSVSGTGTSSCNVGGVVGQNPGTVETSYNTGTVSGTGTSSYVGGVVGYNSAGTVETSYNTGTVSGGSDVGGVVGWNDSGTVAATYYNSTVDSSLSGIGLGSGSATGLSSTNMGNSGSYSVTGWTFASGWNGNGFTNSGNWILGTVTYTNGSTTGTITAPVLVSDMPVATVTSGSSVYDGQAVAPTQSVTMGGTEMTVGPNAGTYGPSTLSAPTTQTSVGSFSSTSWSWTITKAPLGFSSVGLSNPTMTYDGGTSVALTSANSSAILSGFVPGQGATYTGATGTFSSSSAGTHTVTATLSTADFSGSGTGFSWSNYTLPALTLSGTGTILPANVSSGTGGGSGGTGGGGFSNLAVPPPIENLVENMNQSPSTPPLAVSSASGGNVMSSGGTGDGILDASDLPK